MKNKLILLFVILFIIIPTGVLAKCTDSKGNEIITCNYEEAKDIVKELMRDYYIRGPYLQYNGSRVSYGTMSPEDATSQNINYKVCAAYADDVYKFSFGIESIDNRNSSGYYTSFPRHSYNVVDVARCLYSKVPGASVSLEGHYSSDDTTLEKAKCDVFDADYKNFLIYYASKSSDGTGNKYVDGYSSNLDKIEIQNFVDKLQPGDVIAYTGHVMVIYDIGTNPITGKKDALVLNSTQQPWIRTRIYGTSQISYNQYKSKYYYYNEYGTETPIATNGILDVEEEGTIQFFWLGTSSNWQYTEDGKRYLSCPNTDECVIIRPYYKSGTDAVFNYAISEDMYKKSKLRLEYPGLFIDKTVDVGTNDVVHIGDTLTYTIEVTNKSQETFTGTGSKYSSFYVEEQLDSKVEYVPGSLTCDLAPCEVGILRTNGNIYFKFEGELQPEESTTLTYSVKVKDDLNNVGKTISSTGKFYKSDTGAYISTATIKNKIVPKVKKSKEITTQDYNIAYNIAESSGKTGLALIDEVIKNTLNEDFKFSDNFDFENIIGRKIESGTNRNTSNGVYLKNYTKNNVICTTNNIYARMLLNGYFGGLIYKSVSEGSKVSEYFLPLWSSSSSSTLDPCATTSMRAKTINGEDFKNGDVLIYYVDYTKTKTSLINTKEQGLYAYIYIDGEFKGKNGSGNTVREKFTYDYYVNNSNLSILDKLYPNFSSSTAQAIIDYQRDVKNSLVSVSGTTESVVDRKTMSFVNYQTLFDKDYYIILRPELVIKEPAQITIKTSPKTEYLKNIENLDLTGGKLALKYNDGTEEEINLTDPKVKVTGFDNSVVKPITLTITYDNDLTTELVVNIIESEYTVTFNTNGGSSVSSQTINHGSKVTKPNNPTKSGYTFVNWYKDSALTEVYDFNTAVTGNLTLYAKWEEVNTIILDPEDYTYDSTNNYIDLIEQNTKLSEYIDKLNIGSDYTYSTTLNNNDIVYTGSKVKILNNSTQVLELTNIVRGDINGDGLIKSGDYIKVKKHIMETDKITDAVLKKAADVNTDNKITSQDYIRIKKIVMGNS